MRADRLLSILMTLQVHGRMTAKQLAERLEVSERTIHRDMEALGAAGVPVVAERGAGGGWELLEGFRTSLTALTAAEINRLLLMRQRIFIDVSGWKGASEPPTTLPVVQDAVWRDRRLRITYGEDSSASERVIDPLGLVAKGSVWYVVAAIDGTIRSYRVSRIRSAEILAESFVRPADFDLARFWETSAAQFRERLPRYDVVARVEPAAMPWLRSMMRFGAIDSIDGDVVRMHFDNEDAAHHTLAGFGCAAEVIEPAVLRARIIAAAKSIASRE